MTDGTHAHLDHLLQGAGLKLSQVQYDRLAWLVQHYGAATVLGQPEDRYHDTVVVLTGPPSGAGAELFYRSLSSSCAVVIPFGENPAFDFLKTKLTEFGTVGPSPQGPHELWWGSTDWARLCRDVKVPAVRPRVISYYADGTDPQGIRAFEHTLADLDLDSHIEPLRADSSGLVLCFEKVNFLRRMWSRYQEPLLFVDAGSILRKSPFLPSMLGCDVALHKWNRWEISALTLYLSRSGRAEQLLRTWHQLAASYPTIWDGYLLDQAWSLTSSQCALDTVWLPRSYHAMKGDLGDARATILHDQQTTTLNLGPDPDFASMVRTARRAGRASGRDAFMIMTSEAVDENGENGVAVIMRDIGASDAETVAATVEAVTRAFAEDCGGYKQFELSLCTLKDDLRAARQTAQRARYRVLEIMPGQLIPHDFFAAPAERTADQMAVPARNVLS